LQPQQMRGRGLSLRLGCILLISPPPKTAPVFLHNSELRKVPISSMDFEHAQLSYLASCLLPFSYLSQHHLSVAVASSIFLRLPGSGILPWAPSSFFVRYFIWESFFFTSSCSFIQLPYVICNWPCILLITRVLIRGGTLDLP